jgi:Lrp/AsnC family transcriptional regulator for asnA, asnC and gidA
MQVIAVSNPQKLGYQIEVLIGIHADIDRVSDILDRLTGMEEIRTVSICSGVYDVLLVAHFRSNDELLDFLLRKLAAIPGIRKTETSYMLRTAKRTYDWPVAFAQPEKGEATGRRRRRTGASAKA